MTDLLGIFRELLQIEAEKDSLEIGTPAKGGAIKVYGSFDEPEAFKRKLDAALEIREYARSRIEATIVAGFEKSVKGTEGTG